jgi:hypothetical protein
MFQLDDIFQTVFRKFFPIHQRADQSAYSRQCHMLGGWNRETRLT